MVSQKKIRKQSNELDKIKEILAEIQNYVHKHHVTI